MLLKKADENKGIIIFTLLILSFMFIATNRVEKLNNNHNIYNGVVYKK